LKRRNAFSRPAFSLAPLLEAGRRIRSGSSREKKRMLLGFLRDYSRYLRDLHDWRLIKEAMEAIYLAKEEKWLVLSRENRSLYEFLLPDERTLEEKPILNHTILKADIRGSMDITYTMRAKGLNPASHFSLNFFDPISEILFEYGGSKVFIEGDAIILSIVEHEETPRDWYCVARACGLAIRILQIVERYNRDSRKHQLPVLEVGIGICYNQGPPAFLFDGNSRIMISPAINLADRLSGCDKRLRKRFRDENRVFNVHVFEGARKEEVEATADDLSLRYNINGIELDSGGFAKLGREIHLKRVLYPTENNEQVPLHIGKVPTLTGKYQLLALREGVVPKIHPETLEVIGETSRKYYEVCTHPAIYKFLG
jgi:class 3 adenylate cyclase